jgi:hypothetical protein
MPQVPDEQALCPPVDRIFFTLINGASWRTPP